VLFGQKKLDAEVGKQIVEYCELIQKTVQEFRRMIEEYVASDKHFKKQTLKVHRMERECDAVRRSIQRAMFEGAFLPAYREDYITLLEKLDKVANLAEDTGDTIYLLRPAIPEELRSTFLKIAELTERTFEPIPMAIKRLLKEAISIEDVEKHVEADEREIDKLQFQATRLMFKDESIDKADALCLKLLIDQMADVSDKIENVIDHLAIIAIKRRW